MRLRNFTPHPIAMNDGRVFESEGVARVSASFSKFDERLFCNQVFGEIEGLPEEEEGVFIIVSGMVKSASNRGDLIAPATGHPETVRNVKGHIVSVPGFIK